MDVLLISLAVAWQLLYNFWWLFIPIAIAWAPGGKHIKWAVAAGFAFYGAFLAYAFFGWGNCSGPCGVELLSLPAWLLSSTIYLIVGLHRWVGASEGPPAPDA